MWKRTIFQCALGRGHKCRHYRAKCTLWAAWVCEWDIATRFAPSRNVPRQWKTARDLVFSFSMHVYISCFPAMPMEIFKHFQPFRYDTNRFMPMACAVMSLDHMRFVGRTSVASSHIEDPAIVRPIKIQQAHGIKIMTNREMTTSEWASANMGRTA